MNSNKHFFHVLSKEGDGAYPQLVTASLPHITRGFLVWTRDYAVYGGYQYS